MVGSSAFSASSARRDASLAKIEEDAIRRASAPDERMALNVASYSSGPDV